MATLPAPTRQALTALMMLLIFDDRLPLITSPEAPLTRPAITFPNRGRRAMMSERIRPHHLERKAILYVRQSSAYQVLRNRESSALQYAMRDRLIALGWSEIETVDDDLGRSAAGGVARAGFEREGRPASFHVRSSTSENPRRARARVSQTVRPQAKADVFTA